MTSQWNSFTNYRVGDQVQNGSSVIYGCILANTNQPPPNGTYWNNLAPVATGIASLQALTNADNGGNLVLASSTATFTTTPSTGTIDMVITYPVAPVSGVNSLTGDVAITSPASSIIDINNSTGAVVVDFKANTSGRYTEPAGGVDTITISPVNCNSNSIILITYIHAGGGGGAQYIKSISPTTGAFTIVLNTNVDVNDEIVWFVASIGSAPPP